MAREGLPENVSHQEIFVRQLPFPYNGDIRGAAKLTRIEKLPVLLEYWKKWNISYDINRKEDEVMGSDKSFIFNVS